MARSEALKRAQERYDAKRPSPVAVRFTDEELAALRAAARPGESAGQTVKRLVLERIG